MPKCKLCDYEHSVEQTANISQPFKKAVSLSIDLVDAFKRLEINARKLVKPIRVLLQIILPEAGKLLLRLELEKRTNF